MVGKMNSLFSEEQVRLFDLSGPGTERLNEERARSVIDGELSVGNLSDDELLEFLEMANTAYRAGTPIVSDSDYDFVFRAELEKRNPGHPFLRTVEPESAFEGKTVELPAPMLSTDKTYSRKDLEDGWVRRVAAAAEDVGLGLEQILIRVTPKLDGFAAYDDGERLYTRGDGRRGTDVTRVFDRGLAVGGDGVRGQGAGEIVVSKSYFNSFLSGAFDNTRNLQASILREKDLDPLVIKAISEKAAVFFPFNALPSWQGSIESFLSNFEEIVEEAKKSVDYDVDGVICEVVNEEIKTFMGSTNHHHRWQIAFKENVEKAEVRVLDVRPQTSRSGRVNPVAELEPTRLSGAVISNSTAHHYGMVQSLGIGPQAVVELVRSGMVIPKIERVITPAEPKIPEQCPSCGSSLLWEKDYLYCSNTADCPAQIENTLEHFFKTIRNVDGFGPKAIQKMHGAGVKTVYEIYALNVAELVGMGFGDKVSQNLIDQLARSRAEPLEDWRFLAAFGVYRLGLGMCERLLQHFPLPEIFSITVDEMRQIEGFAEITAAAAVEGLGKVRDRFWKLYSMGFNLLITPLITEGYDSSLSSPIAGKLLVFSGAMVSGSREEMKRRAKALGAKVGGSVTGKTDFLVVGGNVGAAKTKDAKEKGVEIITEEAYLSLIRE